jgi:hypothetical protein
LIDRGKGSILSLGCESGAGLLCVRGRPSLGYSTSRAIVALCGHIRQPSADLVGQPGKLTAIFCLMAIESDFL